MNNIFQKTLLFIISIYSYLDAFEVNTHQALTQCAIRNSCGNGYTKNLENFVNHGNLKGMNYGGELFDKYSLPNKKATYANYAKEGKGFEDWKINISSQDHLGMIEAGSVLEDAVFPNNYFKADGRFNNHFYAVQFNSRRNCLFAGYLQTSRALCIGWGARTDNIDWTFNDNVRLYHRTKEGRT